MRIAEAAKLSGLSADTIRYYEKSGLLTPIPRDPAGHRNFAPGDMEWLDIISKLRTTGMPMKEMQRFAALCAQGDSTIPERFDLLAAHRKTMAQRRAEIEACERVLDHKLGIYGPLKEKAQS